MSIEEKLRKVKFFNSNLCRMLKDVLIKGLHSRILVYCVLP